MAGQVARRHVQLLCLFPYNREITWRLYLPPKKKKLETGIAEHSAEHDPAARRSDLPAVMLGRVYSLQAYRSESFGRMGKMKGERPSVAVGTNSLERRHPQSSHQLVAEWCGRSWDQMSPLRVCVLTRLRVWASEDIWVDILVLNILVFIA